MATLHFHKGRQRWVVRTTPGDGPIEKTYRQFRTEAEARAYFEAKGYKLNKSGSPGVGRPRRSGGPRRWRTREMIEVLLAESSRQSTSGCLEWTGRLTNAGYGALTWKQPDGTTIRGAHRIAYFLANGPIPEGMVMDHLCRTRHCINADHLEAVTQRENVMRSPIAPGALNATKTHCPQGHAYTPENTYIMLPKPGRMTTGRLCRTCLRDRHQARKAVSA